MKSVFHVLILITLIAGALILDDYWKKETAFMKKLAVHHLKSEDDEKVRLFYRLRQLSQRLSSEYRTSFKRDIYFLEKIDSTNSKNQFLDLIRDSLSERYAFKDFEELWISQSEVRAIHINDLILASIDSMIEKNINLSSADLLQDSFEMVITELHLGNDSMRFQTEYFTVMDRDTPYIDPFTRKPIDIDQFEVYEAKILEY